MNLHPTSPIDYGYHELSKEEKFLEIIKKSNRFKIFADIYQSENINNVLFLNLPGCRFIEDSSHVVFKFPASCR